MRKFLTCIIVSGLVMTASPALARHHISWDQRRKQIRFQTVDKGYWTQHEVKLTINWAAHWFHVDKVRMMCTADRESNFYYRAYNSSSGASGIYQHLRSYWAGRAATYRQHIAGVARQIRWHPSPFSARANVLVSARMMGHGAWSHWNGGCIY